MMISGLWQQSWTAALVNHLWQSTVFAAGAWLIALALRRNHARIRFWVWLSASVKFLVPFSLLIAAGEKMQSLFAAPVAVKPSIVALVQRIEQPLPQSEYFQVANSAVSGHRTEWLPLLLITAWICGAAFVAARWLRGWLRVRALLKNSSPLGRTAGIPVFTTGEKMEPGIFGIFRPVLLLPQGILNRLSREHLHAITAHELCHVRRRDNLTFAIHMIVETMFWFHPAVWWIGTQLIDERERACDEAVIRSGGCAETYAEGILDICKFCVEPPLACVSGVMGSDLKRRIVRIMEGRAVWKLDRRRKALLAAAAVVAAAAPLALGAMRVIQADAENGSETAPKKLPQFEVASIKPHKSEGEMIRAGFRVVPDGISISGVPLSMLMNEAFQLPENRILNEPEWVKSDRYDIEAKVDPAEAPQLDKLTRPQRLEMILPLLQDRFQLKFHHETKVMNVYTLVPAKGGPRLQPADPNDNSDSAMPPAAGEPPDHPLPSADTNSNVASGKPGNGGKPGDGGGRMMPPKGAMIMQVSPQGMAMRGRDVKTDQLVQSIERVLGATVIDKTGLTGKYDYTLTFAPEMGAGPMGGLPPGPPPSGDHEASPPAQGPSLFTALQEQLGLKLVSSKEPVDVIVIDQIEKPSPN